MHLTQHRNDATISPNSTFNTIIVPKESPPLPEAALRDMTVATIALKFTQSNSVCYALNGQVIGLGAGQQSRIHCTRLAGDKADDWWMRFHQRALNLKWRKGTKRPDKSNAIDLLCSGLVPDSGIEKEDFESKFEEGQVPTPFNPEERKKWLANLSEVACSSDAFVSKDAQSISRKRASLTAFTVPVHRQCLPRCKVRRQVYRRPNRQPE